MRTGSIYIIKNNINNKIYIGQTTMTVRERFMAHMKPSTSKRRSSYKLYNAVNKYGRDEFYYEILEENIPLEEIDSKEIFYINKYDSYKNGYNSTPGGDGRVINKFNNENEILDMAKRGLSTSEISKIVNVHHTTVMRTLHKLGFYYYKEIDVNELKKMVEEGLSNQEIADYLGVNKATVGRHLKKNNISKRKEFINTRENFDIECFKNDFIEGVPPSELVSKYDISNTTIYRLAKKYRLSDVRARRKENESALLSECIYKDKKSGLSISELVDKYELTDKAIYSRISEFKKRVETRP